MKSIGEQMRFISKQQGVTQKELAARLGTTQRLVSKKFRNQNWRESDIERYCAALGIEYEIKLKYSEKGEKKSG